MSGIGLLVAEVLPSFDAQKLIYAALAGLLWGMDNWVLTEMEKLWNPMVTGTDDLNGQTGFGPLLVVNNSQLKTMWGVSFGIATGSLLVLLFTLSVVIWMLNEGVGVRQDLIRNLLYFMVAVVLMATSYFLVNELLALDNALIASVNGQVVLELRSLPAYQGLGLKEPSGSEDAKTLVQLIATFLIGLFIVVELFVLFFVYFARLAMIWVLVVTAPFVLAVSILPGGRGIAVYWLKLLLAVVFFKFVNVLVFMTFVFMAATSSVSLFNELLVAGMLILLALVPTTIMRSLGYSGAVVSIQEVGKHSVRTSSQVVEKWKQRRQPAA